jgi:hypothetical protein
MGNLEKPLTWGLTILLLGYLFVANCKCGEEASCTVKNGFNIESENENIDVNQEIKIEVHVEDENLNADSIVDAVLGDINMQGNIDTVIKIDLVEETAE